MTTTPHRALSTLMAAALVAVTGCTPTAPDETAARPDPIVWQTCNTAGDPLGQQLNSVGALCGTYDVPLDYAAPNNGVLTIAAAFRPASDPAHRIGTLLVETGGPGPSRDGVIVATAGTEGLGPLPPFVAERFDLVAIDPRFFGLSSPRDCGWRTGTYLSQVAQMSPVTDEALAISSAAARTLAEQCAPHAEALKHASTRNIARDIDQLRQRLSLPRISYLGWSYGTYLGAVYAQMFGDSVDRLVLDSSLNPDTYGPGLTRDTAPANAAALSHWARWAAIRNSTYHLGDTEADVLATIDDIIAQAARHPLIVGAHHVTADLVPGLLLTADDSDTSYREFARLVQQLAAAADGVPGPGSELLDAKLGLYSLAEPTPEMWFSATVANQCADRAAERRPEAYREDIRAHAREEPIYGPLARHITPCAFWPTTPLETPTRIDTPHPALLVGATGDPVAPVVGQQTMRRQLGGSRILLLDNSYRHGVYPNAGSECIAAAVETYLLTERLPEHDLTCPSA